MIDTNAPNWQPLIAFLGSYVSLADRFMWMCRDGGLEYYKHRDTRMYLILDGAGTPYRYVLVPTDARAVLSVVTGTISL